MKFITPSFEKKGFPLNISVCLYGVKEFDFNNRWALGCTLQVLHSPSNWRVRLTYMNSAGFITPNTMKSEMVVLRQFKWQRENYKPAICSRIRTWLIGSPNRLASYIYRCFTINFLQLKLRKVLLTNAVQRLAH